MDESSDKSTFERFAEVMHRHGVKYIVIGGQAETLHGSARITYDIDVCYQRSRENLERLSKALREMKVSLRGAPADLPFLVDARTLESGCNFTFNSIFDAVDFLGFVEPIGGFEEVAMNATSYVIDGLTIAAISLDDLIRIKRHLNRPKDRESLMHLLAIKQVREEGSDPPSA
ncbi:MAG: hypothetical protein WD768_14330 [Phycisphaeraceae bacterium]